MSGVPELDQRVQSDTTLETRLSSSRTRTEARLGSSSLHRVLLDISRTPLSTSGQLRPNIYELRARLLQSLVYHPRSVPLIIPKTTSPSPRAMSTTPQRPTTRSTHGDSTPFSIAQDSVGSPRRSSRTKRPPPITPRRFTKFFAPRKDKAKPVGLGARLALKDVRDTELNIRKNDTNERPAKRRRISFAVSSPISSSLPSSPVKRSGFLSSSQDVDVDSDLEIQSNDDDDSEASTDIEEAVPKCRVKTYGSRNLSQRLLETRLDGRRKTTAVVGSSLWQHETANFYSRYSDINVDRGPGFRDPRRPLPSLPFCVASCNTNSLVAVGDEDGIVRLIDASDDHSQTFNETYLALKPHDNAVMDLEFSHDDQLLATTSGDQTCQIIDVPSQRSKWALSGHSASVKKIQFQPESTNMLATCARDGSINIWDTRINPCDVPQILMQPVPNALTSGMRACQPKHTIWDAHHGRMRTRSAASNARSDFSVTSLTFLNTSRPHLIATASESDSVVKLWDIRARHTYRNRPVPISCTAEPKSHEVHRFDGAEQR
jgi:WD40 repeat protein